MENSDYDNSVKSETPKWLIFFVGSLFIAWSEF